MINFWTKVSMTALQQTCLNDLEAAHLLRLLRQLSGLSVEALLLSSSLLQRLLLSGQSLVILDKPFHFSEIAALLLQGAASCNSHTGGARALAQQAF